MSPDDGAVAGPGTLRLHHHYRPPLVSGAYEIALAQELDLTEVDGEGPDSADFSRRQVFHVQASRFRLGPGDVHAVYPPAAAEGDFTGTLPHVVLRRRGLPWQIDLSGDEEKPSPWLALLLFHGFEAPAVQTISLKELVSPNARGVRGPRLSLGLDAKDDRTRVIDVPVTIFRDIAPRKEDLPWLAHVRRVDTGGKELLGLEEDGWFSVVLGNRLPGEGENTAHLISLEGWHDALTDVGGPDADHVRVVSLASWSFVNKSGRGSFRELMKEMGVGPLVAPLPEAIRSRSADGERAARTLVEAVDTGFVPLSYDMRHGEHTAAWYRGPLVPVVPPRARDRGPLATAEAGLIYNEASGVFDVSLAVAWQIGRLLALADGSFSAALSRWRRSGQEIVDRMVEREAAARRFRRADLFRSLGEIEARPEEEREPLLRELLAQLLDPAAIQKAAGQYLVGQLTDPLKEKGVPPLRPSVTGRELLTRDLPKLTEDERTQLRGAEPGLLRAELLVELVRLRRRDEIE